VTPPLRALAQAHIAAMPARDAPEVFGQHASAEAACQAREGAVLLGCLAALQPPAAAAPPELPREERLLAAAAQLLEQARAPPRALPAAALVEA